jgi:hypothetical protein
MLKNFCSLAVVSVGEDARYVQSRTTRQTAVRATTRLNVQCSGRAVTDMGIGLD